MLTSHFAQIRTAVSPFLLIFLFFHSLVSFLSRVENLHPRSSFGSHGRRSTADDTIARHCIEEATEHLAADVGLLKDVRAAFFSAGVHAVSIPLKLRGHVHNHTHTFLAKLVTKDCVRAHREVMTKKNTRFKKHGVYDISYKEFDAACGLLNSEARLLKASRAAGYFCTVAIRRISAALCRLGVRVRARNSV